ncbi:MAG: hypothetical protein BACD_00164 [Bacteroides rodentium]
MGETKAANDAVNQTGEEAQLQRDYPAAALFLANNYAAMLQQKKYIDSVLSGERVFTHEMALEELVRTTSATEIDTGVRVQTGSISNTTERIGLLLAGGYVEKRNAEIIREATSDIEGRIYLEWKLDVIETAMRERLDKTERNICKRLYAKHMTYEQIRSACHEKKLYDHRINKARKEGYRALALEIEKRDGTSGTGKAMTDRLMQEARRDGDYE